MSRIIIAISMILFSGWFGLKVLASEISGTVMTGVSTGNLKAVVSASPLPAGSSRVQTENNINSPVPSPSPIPPTDSPTPSPMTQAHVLKSTLSGQVILPVTATPITKTRSPEIQAVSMAVKFSPVSTPMLTLTPSTKNTPSISFFASISSFVKINWWWLLLVIAVVAEIVHFIPRLF